jgi:DNA-binding GntR family transcriptional regulator
MMLLNASRGWARGWDRGATYHRDLVKVIVSGDAASATRRMRQHIRRGLEGEMEALRACQAAHDQM